MTKTTIPGSESLGAKIKERRLQLGLTIVEAAALAKVGTKTWSRYEAGGSISEDKIKGICNALMWFGFPNEQSQETDISKEFNQYEAWSKYLEERYNTVTAFVFAVGCKSLQEAIADDIYNLMYEPKDTHIKQLNHSMLDNLLPYQFAMEYNYDFLYHMLSELNYLINLAIDKQPIKPNSIMQEILIYLCDKKVNLEIYSNVIDVSAYTNEWVSDILGDKNTENSIFHAEYYIEKDDPYHFSRWFDKKHYQELKNRNSVE